MTPVFVDTLAAALTDSFDRFDCGEPELNDFLKRDALAYATELRMCKLKLLMNKDNGDVIGFYTLSPSKIAVQRLPKNVSRLFFEHHIEFPIPSWLIGKLAVDSRYKDIGLGRALLVDAICNAFDFAIRCGGAVIEVDALNRKVKKNFYERYGFLPLPDCKLKVFMPMNDAQIIFESAKKQLDSRPTGG